MDINNFITELWKQIALQDAKKIKTFYHEDAEIYWHATNERFTLSEFIRANCEYPGDWEGKIKRIETTENIVICVACVWPKDKSALFHVTAFYEFHNGLIKRADEYWCDDGIAPEWRRKMNIGNPIINTLF